MNRFQNTMTVTVIKMIMKTTMTIPHNNKAQVQIKESTKTDHQQVQMETMMIPMKRKTVKAVPALRACQKRKDERNLSIQMPNSWMAYKVFIL